VKSSLTLAGREGFESNVDLIGEQSVQIVTATLEAALVLLAAGLVMVASVRIARSVAVRPMAAMLPRAGRPTCPENDNTLSVEGLYTCLPTRAPPDDPRCELASTAGWRLRASTCSSSCATRRPRVGL
jgi:hypothetical protein